MLFDTYPFSLPPLPYPYEALEPYLDAETLHYHHDKHFKSYVDGLNQALKPYCGLQGLTLRQLLSAGNGGYGWASPGQLPPCAAKAILRNGGGVYNHFLYFQGLAPKGTARGPEGKLLQWICRAYGSVEQFQQAFTQCAMEVFGSGWTVLGLLPNGALRIFRLKNQETLVCAKIRPLLMVDLWEHAYYLKYKNLRKEYLENLWHVLSFPVL